MKTENYETETTAKSETPKFNQLASFTATHATSSLQRFSAACLSELGELKERVRQELVAEFGASLNASLIQQAVQEADSLAATTAFPSLFLPVLAAEKVRSTAAWNSRQAAIRNQTLALAA
jgi:hypothetical protein